jgi:L-alanine-DL-glutamate epimerase-like enolase superfamily enzyme
VAAAAGNCDLCEFNPNVLATANAFLTEPVRCEGGRYAVPSAPGLGIEWNDRGVALTGDA